METDRRYRSSVFFPMRPCPSSVRTHACTQRRPPMETLGMTCDVTEVTETNLSLVVCLIKVKAAALGSPGGQLPLIGVTVVKETERIGPNVNSPGQASASS